jgi:sugar-phosphatase
MIHMALQKHAIRVEGILFDMDGVLISSIQSDERSWMRWAAFHGMAETFNIRETHGRRTIDTIKALRPDLDYVLEADRVEGYDAEDGEGVTALPGARELLEGISLSRWSIVTSASEKVMRHRLNKLGIQIPHNVVTAEMVERGKPHPEPYRLGAARLGFSPTACLVIEDSPSGIKAGKQAGCPVLAVASSHDPHELAEADWVIPSLERIEIRGWSGKEGGLICVEKT